MRVRLILEALAMWEEVKTMLILEGPADAGGFYTTFMAFDHIF